MRTFLKTICLSLCVWLATSGSLHAQEKSPRGSQESPDRKPQGCLPYEPATVTLEGTISRKTFPGPPNYESIKEGDEPETYWILRLPRPICVDRGAEGNGDDPEEDVSDLQLILNQEQKPEDLLSILKALRQERRKNSQ